MFVDADVRDDIIDALGDLSIAPRGVRTLLAEPTFRGFHGMVTELTRGTGFGKGLYTADELSGGQQTSEAKQRYISKICGLVGVSTGEAIEPEPVADAVLQDEIGRASAVPLGSFLLALAEAAALHQRTTGRPASPPRAPPPPVAPPLPSSARSSSSSARPPANRYNSYKENRTADAGSASSWQCAHCGHEHEQSLPYCELCARVRAAPHGRGGDATGSVRLNAGSSSSNTSGASSARNESSARVGSARGEGGSGMGYNLGSGRSSAGSLPSRAGPSGASSTSSAGGRGRASAASSAASSSASGRGGRGRTSGDIYRVPGFGPPARVRQPRRAPSPEPDRGGDDDDDSDAMYEQMVGGRYARYQKAQREREAARKEAEEAHARRRAEAAADKARLGRGEAPRESEATSRAAAAADEAAWQRFSKAGGDSTIGEQDVPWPTLQAATLGLDPARANADERKKAFRLQSLRWHPDKFVQAYGSRLDPDHREAILKRVTEVSQEINALYQAAEAAA